MTSVPRAAQHASNRRWPHRAAVTLAVATGLLLLVGGLVTTYRVGMAVVDWPTTFGYSMFRYPLDQMLENWGVTVEHSHRLLASVVGMLTIVLVLVAHAQGGTLRLAVLAIGVEVVLVGRVLTDGTVGGSIQATLLTIVAFLLVAAGASSRARGRCLLASGTHLAVIGQGLLGGTRVLENSQHLAFLHGSAAQLVAALIAANLVVTSRGWSGVRPSRPVAGARWLAVWAGAATLLVFGQIVLGAWLRHSGHSIPLVLHIMGSFFAGGAVLLLARRLGAHPDSSTTPLRSVRRWLLVSLVAQIGLGLLALLAILVVGNGFHGVVTVTEAVTASLHVLVGATLLGSCTAALLWTARLVPSGRTAGAPGAARLEGGAA